MANLIEPQVNGPLLIKGDIDVVAADGSALSNAGNKLWLCRCGQSATKPYCDGSHNKSGFADAATVAADYTIKKPEPGTPGNRLRLTPRTNGPLHCFGKMTIAGANETAWSGDQANLCRCGQSGNKPFCDGSHRNADFKAS